MLVAAGPVIGKACSAEVFRCTLVVLNPSLVGDAHTRVRVCRRVTIIPPLPQSGRDKGDVGQEGERPSLLWCRVLSSSDSISLLRFSLTVLLQYVTR